MATETTSTAVIRPLMYEDLLATPEGDGKRYEIIAGKMVVSASPSQRHTWISFQFARRLADYVEQQDCGLVYHSPVDVRLTRYDVVVPDVIFLSTERTHVIGEQIVEGAPDLVVEVLSPSTRSRDLTTKLRLYAQTGVQEYWLIDPDLEAITLYTRQPSGAYEAAYHDADSVRSLILPGFEVSITDLLAGLPTRSSR